MKEFSFRDDVLPLKDKLYRLALRITFHTAEAEDVVQDTLLRVWSRRADFSEIESLEAFSLTVCRNLALDRKEKKDNQHSELDEAANDTPTDTSFSPSERLIQAERLVIVHKLFQELPEKARTVMQLRDIEGKSYQEIVEITGRTLEQVKTTLFRARRQIRDKYSKIENYGL